MLASSESFVEEEAVDDRGLDSMVDDAASEGVGVGVAVGR